MADGLPGRNRGNRQVKPDVLYRIKIFIHKKRRVRYPLLFFSFRRDSLLSREFFSLSEIFLRDRFADAKRVLLMLGVSNLFCVNLYSLVCFIRGGARGAPVKHF